MVSRTSFSFSPTGVGAVCLRREDPSKDWCPEWWSLDGDPPRALPEVVVRSAGAQLVALDDGRIVVCQPSDPPDGHELVIAAGCGSPAPRYGTIAAPALRLIPVAGPVPALLAVTRDDSGRSTLWRVNLDTLTLDRVLDAPGLLAGGVWLDPAGTRLALTRSSNGRVETVVADLHNASLERFRPDRPGLRLLHGHPESGLLVVADAHGRIGWATVSEPVPRWPAGMAWAPGTSVLAVDPAGERIALRTELGARSGLYLFTPSSGESVEVVVPDGVIGAAAAWPRTGLHLPFSGSSHPPGVYHITGDPPTLMPLTCGAGAGRGSGDPQLESFPGPAGPIEAVVYGDWRGTADVVVALHGGPDAAWSLAGSPFLAGLADEGLAIVAINPAGSRGYGRERRASIVGAWGGPDLADVRAVAETIHTLRRSPLLLFGGSYGAYLGLLALAADPVRWSRAVVVAPFTSGDRLHRHAGPRVRALLARLGGHDRYSDAELGPRDALCLAERITAEILLVHGTGDPIIPVTHARDVYERLRDGPADVTYLEIPDAGHDPLSGPGSQDVRRRVTAFLAGVRPGSTIRHRTRKGGEPHGELHR